MLQLKEVGNKKGKGISILDLKLKGKNAIVTGGSAGIGFACAKALVEEGTNVIIIGRNQKHLEEAVEKLLKINNR